MKGTIIRNDFITTDFMLSFRVSRSQSKSLERVLKTFETRRLVPLSSVMKSENGFREEEGFTLEIHILVIVLVQCEIR